MSRSAFPISLFLFRSNGSLLELEQCSGGEEGRGLEIFVVQTPPLRPLESQRRPPAYSVLPFQEEHGRARRIITDPITCGYSICLYFSTKVYMYVLAYLSTSSLPTVARSRQVLSPSPVLLVHLLLLLPATTYVVGGVGGHPCTLPVPLKIEENPYVDGT